MIVILKKVEELNKDKSIYLYLILVNRKLINSKVYYKVKSSFWKDKIDNFD